MGSYHHESTSMLDQRTSWIGFHPHLKILMYQIYSTYTKPKSPTKPNSHHSWQLSFCQPIPPQGQPQIYLKSSQLLLNSTPDPTSQPSSKPIILPLVIGRLPCPISSTTQRYHHQGRCSGSTRDLKVRGGGEGTPRRLAYLASGYKLKMVDIGMV